MKTLLALTVLFWFASNTYFIMTIQELRSDLGVQKALNKACEADRMWKEIKIKELTEKISNND